jgi:dTMP kinase
LSNLKKKKYQLVNSNLDIKKNEELVLRKIDQLIK